MAYATYSKRQLKDVFSGLSSILLQTSTDLTIGTESAPAAYSASKTYKVGDKVSQGGKYYTCKTAITTAETFDSSKWTEYTLSTTSNITLAPDFDLPVNVDNFSMEEGDPTAQHYKVFGEDSDWILTMTKGDFDIRALVPTLNEQVLKMAYGEENVEAYTAVLNGNNFSGVGITFTDFEVHGALILLNQRKDRIVIVPHVVLVGTWKYANPQEAPIGVQLDGGIEAGDGPDVLYLKKAA